MYHPSQQNQSILPPPPYDHPKPPTGIDGDGLHPRPGVGEDGPAGAADVLAHQADTLQDVGDVVQPAHLGLVVSVRGEAVLAEQHPRQHVLAQRRLPRGGGEGGGVRGGWEGEWVVMMMMIIIIESGISGPNSCGYMAPIVGAVKRQRTQMESEVYI